MEELTPKANRKFVWGVLFFALLHLFLAIAYSHVIPYRESGISRSTYLRDIGAPDERAHANMVQYALESKPFPILGTPEDDVNLKPGEPDFLERFQAHQPPLFYVLTAKYLKARGFESVEDREAGFAARNFNGLIGAFGVIAVALIAWKISREKWIAIGAAAIVALNPMNVALSAAISNDPLLITLCSACLGSLFWAKDRDWNITYLLLSTVFAGLAMLTKSTGILIMVPLLVAAVWAAIKNRKFTGFIVVLAVLIPAPWWQKNMQVYGEPLLLNAFSKAWAPQRLPPTRSSLAMTRWLLTTTEATAESSTGVFGYFDIHYPTWIPLTAVHLAAIILVIGALSLWYSGKKWGMMITGLFLLLVAASFYRFNMTYDQPQARYLFPGLGFIATLMAAGLVRLWGSKAVWIWAGLYAVLNVYTIVILMQAFALRTDRILPFTGVPTY
ncbi:MAG: glycosyltransferase family 39 protein [Armatimonadetes bacterium]|nr:glycosyltransferase family 39 protein [Armatimonadota bacterium]